MTEGARLCRWTMPVQPQPLCPSVPSAWHRGSDPSSLFALPPRELPEDKADTLGIGEGDQRVHIHGTICCIRFSPRKAAVSWTMAKLIGICAESVSPRAGMQHQVELGIRGGPPVSCRDPPAVGRGLSGSGTRGSGTHTCPMVLYVCRAGVGSQRDDACSTCS